VGDVSSLLQQARDGDASATHRLAAAVYDELLRIARAQDATRRGAATLQATAVVHEAWLKLSPHLNELESKRHLLSVASKAMRQVIADHAKAHARDKRGGAWRCVTLSELDDPGAERELDLVAFHDALERLEALHPRHAQVVELRLLGSLTLPEVALELGVSLRTAESDWRMARAWLVQQFAH